MRSKLTGHAHAGGSIDAILESGWAISVQAPAHRAAEMPGGAISRRQTPQDRDSPWQTGHP